MLKPASATYLVRNDPAAADGILGHNEFGERTCKWNAPNPGGK